MRPYIVWGLFFIAMSLLISVGLMALLAAGVPFMLAVTSIMVTLIIVLVAEFWFNFLRWLK